MSSFHVVRLTVVRNLFQIPSVRLPFVRIFFNIPFIRPSDGMKQDIYYILISRAVLNSRCVMHGKLTVNERTSSGWYDMKIFILTQGYVPFRRRR
jgi:hypothetical protein